MATKSVESGVQLFSRIAQTLDLSDINPILLENGPRSNQIIEIVGDSIYDLQLDFILRCILPKELNENWKSCGVILMNTEFHLNILKIVNVINAYLKHYQIKNRSSVIERSLNNLIILNCFDGEQIDITIRSLEKIVHNHDNIGFIVIDNITSQYWQAKESKSRLSLDQHSRTRFDLLYNIVKNLNIVLMFGRQQLSDFRKSLSNYINYKLIITKIDQRQHQINVIDYDKETDKTVQFNLDLFITFC